MARIRQDEALIREAYALFDEFYRSTQGYRDKCRANEEYWKANHWHDRAPKEPNEPQPVTPTLFSTLEAMLADVMDCYPEALIMGVEPRDDAMAERLTHLIKFVLKRRNHRKVYREKSRSALIKGTSVQEVFWDPAIGGGMGDVSVREWDIANFAWDPKFEDIQQGRAVFKVGFYPRSWYKTHYPQQAELIKGDEYALRGEMDYVTSDRSQEIMLLEYWRREYLPEERRYRVHFSKLAGGALLEDSRAMHPEGIYAHGMYPFIVEPLYPLSGQPVGLGVVDVLKNLQQYADQLDQIIMKNALTASKMKLLVNRSADIDEPSLLNCDAELVRGARIDEGAVRWMQTAPLSSYVLHYQQMKLQAIKEESGQNLFNRGESRGGVTAASAILALQEAGSKRSRLIIDQLFDGFERLVRMLISVIQENYTEQRFFRIDGNREQLFAYGGDGEREIDFDVSIHVQKQTAYTTLYQNELALQLLRVGVIQPADALEMMAFEGKEKILKRAQEIPLGAQLPAPQAT